MRRAIAQGPPAIAMSESSSSHRETELILRDPPGERGVETMLERYLDAAQGIPRNVLNQIRANFIAVVNSAIRHPSYKQVASARSHSRVEQESDHIASILQLVCQDCQLGMSYVTQEKGSHVVKHVLTQSADMQVFVKLGMQLRERFYERIESIQDRNIVFPSDYNSEKDIALMPMIIRNADSLLTVKSAYERPFVQCEDISTRQFSLESAQRFLALADTLGLTHSLCRDSYADHELGTLFHKFAPQTIGFLDVAVFVAAYSALHGVEPVDTFTVPAALYKEFERSFVMHVRGGKSFWRMDSDVRYRLEAACNVRFNNSAEALTCVQSCVMNMETYLHENMIPPPELATDDFFLDDRKYLRGMFPHPDVLRAYRDLSPAIAAENDCIKIAQSKRQCDSGECQLPRPKESSEIFNYSTADILSANDHSLRIMLKRFPNELEWYSLLLEQVDAQTIALVITKVFNMNVPYSRCLATFLLLVELDLDPVVYGEELSVQDLFALPVESGDRVQKKEKEVSPLQRMQQANTRAFQVLQYLPPIVLTYVERVSSIEKESIKDSIESYDIEPQDCDLLHVSNWHPQYAHIRELRGSSYLTQMIINSRMNSRNKNIQLAVRQGWVRTSDECFMLLTQISSQFDSTSMAKFADEVLSIVPPEIGIRACTALMCVCTIPVANGASSMTKKSLDLNLDIPMLLFLDSVTGEYNPPALWAESAELNKFLSAELREKLRNFLLSSPPDTSVHNAHGVEGIGKRHDFLMSHSAINSSEVQSIVQTLIATPDDRILDILIQKALASSKKIQNTVLKQMLPFAIVQLLKEYAITSKDASTVASLKIDTWKDGVALAAPYEKLHRLLQPSDVLRAAVVRALTSHQNERIANL